MSQQRSRPPNDVEYATSEVRCPQDSLEATSLINIVITICTVIVNRMLNGENKPLFFLKPFSNRFGVRFQNVTFLNHVVFLFFTSIL